MPEHRVAIERSIYRVLLFIVFCVAAYYLLPLAWNYLSPFIIVIPLASMLQPFARVLQKRLHLKRSPAVLFCVLLVIVLLLALLIWFLSFGVSQINRMLNSVPSLVRELIPQIRDGLNRVLSSSDLITESERVWLNTTINDALGWLQTEVPGFATYLLSEAAKFTVSIPYALIYANFLAIGLYFITKDYDHIMSRMPGRKGHESKTRIDRLSKTGISGAVGYFKVQLIYAAIVTAASMICWQILGNPYAAVIAIAAGLLELIPLVGCGALYIIWGLIALLVGGIPAALPPVILYVALFVLRKITEPRIMSQNIGLTPLLSLVGMFIGMRAGGIAGLIAGPVLMTIIVAVLTGDYLTPFLQDIQTIRVWLHNRWGDPLDSPKKEESDVPADDPQPSTADHGSLPGDSPRRKAWRAKRHRR